jgi:hypothetical protein
MVKPVENTHLPAMPKPDGVRFQLRSALVQINTVANYFSPDR